MLSEERKDLLALYGVPGIGAKMHARLLERFGSPAQVFSASPQSLMEVEGIGEKTAASILTFNRAEFIAEQIKRMERCGAAMLVRADTAYPPLLKAFRSAPPVLFIRGDSTVLSWDTIAFVGTRHPTDYGIRMTRTLVEGMVHAGFCIVSGMAAGIDTAAHQSALDSGGATAAVFGCGVDVIYPVGNRKLSGEIEKNGCLVSHFPMGVPASAGNFPARNAVVAGMSKGTVVVEAPSKSGALITADLAQRAGRPLMTVPGNADSPSSEGANELLSRGAVPALNAADIIRALGMTPPPRIEKHAAQKPLPSVKPVPALPGLAGDIVKALTQGPLQVDDLGMKLGCSVSALLNELTLLEMDGYILQRPGKVFGLA